MIPDGGLLGAGSFAGALLMDEPTGLALDFPNQSALVRGGSAPYFGSPGGLLTVSRASPATYTDIAGVTQVAANDTLRYDYDPVSHVPLGILSEEQRTNLLLNSASLGTQSVTVAAVPYTLSFKGTGSVTLSGVSTSGPLVGTGANDRVSLTFTPTAGSLTLTPSGSVLEAQLEVGTKGSSYIPTTGAQVTRLADTISLATSLFPISTTMAIIVEARTFAPDDGLNGTDAIIAPVVSLFNSTGSIIQQVTLNRQDATTRVARCYSYVRDTALVTPIEGLDNSFPIGAFTKLGLKRNGTAFDLFAQGILQASVTSGGGTLDLVTMRIGANRSANRLNGHIKTLKILPRAPSSAEMLAFIA